MPLRQRNDLLVAAGFAPAYGERGLGHPSLKPAMAAVEQLLKGHEPYPALAVDRGWNMVLANRSIAPLLEGIEDASLLQPPVNVLRLSLHPRGLAPRIANLGEWRRHLIERLRLQTATVADPALEALEKELVSYPAPPLRGHWDAASSVAVPLRLRMGGRVLSFISAITIFGTPMDITLSELAIESFFPADEETAARLREIASSAA